MMTERVQKLKENQNQTQPSFSAERAVLVTDAYAKFGAEPNVLLKAKMLEYILRKMTIFIQDGELIVGNHTDKPRCAPVYPEFSAGWIVDKIDEFSTRSTDKLTISEKDKNDLLEALKTWEGKSFDESTQNACRPETLKAEKSGVITIGNRDCATGHILPYYSKLLQKGLNGYIAECRAKIDSTQVDCKEKQQQVDFWNAVIIVSQAAIDFAKRYAKLAEELAKKESDPKRKAELLEISRNCAHVPANKPSTFFEAVQFVWFIHLVITIESNGHGNSFGRFDQYINPFYVADLNAGRVSEEKALEILECFFIKTTDIIKLRDAFYSESFAGYPVWQNMVIAGQKADGTDACNPLTMLVLKANADVQTSQPTVSLRYHDGISQEVFDYGVRMIQQGMSTPAFFNDKLVVPLILQKGAPIEEAREWGILGCVEPVVAGKTDGRPTAGYVNLLKCVELVLHNGTDPLTGQEIGVKTGDFRQFTNIEQVIQAIYAQMDHFVGMMIVGFNAVTSLHATRQQMAFASMTLDGCIQSGKSTVEGGTKYRESGVFACGIANAADAIAAIDEIVFKQKRLTPQELLDVSDNNFENNEKMRLTLLNKAPKYGNDNDFVDGIARDLIRHYREELKSYRDSRGGKFVLTVESQSMNISQGKCVGATPDGRFAYDALNDNCSPVMGRDTNGPTATIRSVSKLDQLNATNGCLYNLRFDPRSIGGEKGRQVLGGVIKTYFDRLGEHIQINVVDNETLCAAQVQPEKYRNLLVRVAGYLAYFTELDKPVQDNIIQRTLHSC